jgi:hypothetical protein
LIGKQAWRGKSFPTIGIGKRGGIYSSMSVLISRRVYVSDELKKRVEAWHRKNVEEFKKERKPEEEFVSETFSRENCAVALLTKTLEIPT